MRIKIALFFTLLFSVLLVTPTVISMIDNTQNVSFFLDMNEEEESKGKEASKDLEIKIQQVEQQSTYLKNGIQKKKNISFKSKNYISEYPKKTTPPPQLLS
ncbi:MAG: hypothetical protein AB8B78_05390 [Polaribacter sp.]